MVKIVALACVCGLGSCFSMLGSVSVRLMPRIGIDERRFGSLVSALMITCLFASLVIGVITDLVGLKPVAISGFIIAASGTLVIARARSYSPVLLACIVLGFGAIALNTAGNALLSLVLFGGRNQAAALNLGNVSFGLGVLLTPLLVSYLFQRTSYTIAVSVLAVILAVPAGLAIFASYPVIESGFGLKDVVALLSGPSVPVAAMMLFCYESLETSFCSWLPPFGKEVVGRARPQADTRAVDACAQRLLSLFAVGMMAGRYITSEIPKITLYGSWYIAGASLLAGLTIIIMIQSRRVVQVQAAAFLGGLALAPIFPTLAGVTFSKFSPRVHGSIMGIMFGMGFLGASITPRVIGHLAAGSSVQRSLRLLFPLCLALVVLAFVLFRV